MFVLSSLVTGPSFMSIWWLLLDLWQFLFIKESISNQEIGNKHIWVLPNIRRLGKVRNTKSGTNVCRSCKMSDLLILPFPSYYKIKNNIYIYVCIYIYTHTYISPLYSRQTFFPFHWILLFYRKSYPFFSANFWEPYSSMREQVSIMRW